ncbi:MAG: hypothetical protein KKF46_01080 [Nanoarchaeota archaeon]|nr:hypothetical protein [Nanoarchaeota archaeon]MBU1320926.1 hypothetical protein [Nanoarchaeota archaeon]
MENKKIKAVGLFSGGLDSALAIKLVQEQGIDVVALNFVGPFCTCVNEGCSIPGLAKQLGVEVKLMNKGKEYLRLVRKPKYGYGKNMNPCVDCKIFILKKAKQYAKKIGAKFIFTGEVVGQRPMSQHYQTLMQIEKNAGLKGKLVRPLCAGLLEPTEAEKKAWVDREKFLSFQGRTRTPQLDLAKKYKMDGFMCGGSGCRLTEKDYSRKLKDLLKFNKRIKIKDITLLKLGRHFRLGKNKIIVGRDEFENKQLLKLKNKSDLVFETKEHMGPTTLLQGKADKKAVKLAAELTATHSDAKEKEVLVMYGKKKLSKDILVKLLTREQVESFRI